MTTRDVSNRLAEIRCQAEDDDDEIAHILEDELYFAVLSAISELDGPAAKLAKEAIKSRLIKFARCCA